MPGRAGEPDPAMVLALAAQLPAHAWQDSWRVRQEGTVPAPPEGRRTSRSTWGGRPARPAASPRPGAPCPGASAARLHRPSRGKAAGVPASASPAQATRPGTGSSAPAGGRQG